MRKACVVHLKTEPTPTHVVYHNVHYRDVLDLLGGQFEPKGGVSRWRILYVLLAPGFALADSSEQDPPGCHIHLCRLEMVPTIPGCALVIDTSGGGVNPAVLDDRAIVRGIHVMRERYSQHFDDWISGYDSTRTGDVFLQCCLYGDTIFD